MRAYIRLFFARKDDKSPWHVMYSGLSKSAICGHDVPNKSRIHDKIDVPKSNVCKSCMRSLGDTYRFRVEDGEAK